MHFNGIQSFFTVKGCTSRRVGYTAHLDEERLQLGDVLFVARSERGRVLHRQLGRLYEKRAPDSVAVRALSRRRRRRLRFQRKTSSVGPPRPSSEAIGDLGNLSPVQACRGVYLGGCVVKVARRRNRKKDSTSTVVTSSTSVFMQGFTLGVQHVLPSFCQVLR